MNRIHVAPPVALALLALLMGCKAAAPPEEFPQAAADAWLGSFNGGDVAGLVLSYSADARLLPPDEPPITGPAAIEAFWQAYGPGQTRLEVSEVEASKIGDFWFREGAYKAQFANEGEPRVGKFIELWKQESDNWMMYRQIWNRNAPLEPVPPPGDAPADEPA
jgi:ketosteroid isomerase-like protein